MGRTLTATRMGIREQRRRALLIVLLVAVPWIFITWSFAVTEPAARLISLPGGESFLTDMRQLHGAIMVPITVGFLAGLIGLFVVSSALESDRRLVVAGFRPGEVVVPRLVVLAAGAVLVSVVSIAVTSIDFSPASWGLFAGSTILAALIYGLIGGIAGVLFGQMGAVYFMFFLPMMDFGVAQNPMFFDGDPQGWAQVLPAYGPTRVLIDAAFSQGFDATAGLAAALAWLLGLILVLSLLLARSAGGGRAAR